MTDRDRKDDDLREEEAEEKTGKKLRAWESRRFRSNLLFAALVILIYFFVTNLGAMGGKIFGFFSLFAPLLIGVLLALILNIPLRSIEKLLFLLRSKSKVKRKPSDRMIATVSLVLTFVLTLLLLYFVGYSVIPQIVSSFKSMIGSFEAYYPKALTYLEGWGIDTSDLRELMSKIDLNEIWKALTSNAGTILDTAFSTVKGALAVVTNIVTAVIFAVYLLANRNNLKRQSGKLLMAYFKPATAHKIRYVGKLVLQTFSNFFSGQCLEAVILGIIFFIAMSVFRFPYAVVISVIIAVTALIPYVGAFVGCAVGALLIFMHSPMSALFFIIMFLVIQQLENHLIYPRVVGTSVGLPAIWTFAALIAGGAIYGVAGMILFIPAASVVYSLLKSDVNARIKKKYGDAETVAEAPADTPAPATEALPAETEAPRLEAGPTEEEESPASEESEASEPPATEVERNDQIDY
jgi:predicted PurR-regulated permease PerM